MRVTMRIRGEHHVITREDIIGAARSTQPELIKVFYVVIDGKRYPPKQLILLATGTRKPFDSMNARSALTRLGFDVKALT